MRTDLEHIRQELNNMINTAYAKMECLTDKYKICEIVGMQRALLVVEKAIWAREPEKDSYKK